ncbi:MAG: hypothetical protein VB111_04210 [Clostridiaceae bacterium]|nr:hypothetical protein [Clostridiaceae bacterium]
MKRWHVRFAVDAAPASGVSFIEGVLTVTMLFTLPDAPDALSDRMRTPLTLTAAAFAGDRAVVSCDGCRVSLFINNILTDEEWPLGATGFPDALTTIPGFTVTDTPYPEPPFVSRQVIGLNGFRPAPNAHAGDCMPFVDGNTFRLYYLYDRRHHCSKWGLGAHQWAQVSSDDLRTWTTHPLAVPITDPSEGSICTGSVIRRGALYHAFYAVRTCDGSPAKLTSAVSHDGIRFEKTGRVFTLPAPYDGPSARDPKVYPDGDGFTMLVTTSMGQKGCLAALHSTDLETWTLQAPALVLEEPTQPECADCFTFAGHTYLVFGLSGTTHYRIYDNRTAAWTAPQGEDIIADRFLRVPKAAVWQNRLIFAGFRIDPPDAGWGGVIALYEAFADADGSLTFAEVSV